MQIDYERRKEKISKRIICNRSLIKYGGRMIKQEITFQTITPLFTGGVDMKMTEIKPSSIMGSLRFWFDVICHFSGINNKFKYNDNKKPKIGNEYLKILITESEESERKNKLPDDVICCKLMLTPTEYYFGTTGWKSKIGIEEISMSADDLYFVDKSNKRIVNGKNWYLPEKYYMGSFTIVFFIESKEIAENILFPLLNFIQEYGFLGAKNNIGFGRVKVIEPNISTNSQLHILKDEVLWENIIHRAKNESDLFNINQINYFKIDDKVGVFQNNIRNLLIKKSQIRSWKRIKPERHYIFGSTAKDEYYTFNNSNKITAKGPNATKIIPVISEKEIGFLGIPGIISMKESEND